MKEKFFSVLCHEEVSGAAPRQQEVVLRWVSLVCHDRTGGVLPLGCARQDGPEIVRWQSLQKSRPHVQLYCRRAGHGQSHTETENVTAVIVSRKPFTSCSVTC